jgi:DNA-binding SARP family transcriptional activator/tetratricopeptide (TPR) repeat protein
MEFRLLGPLRAWRDGQPVDLGVRKQRFVLAMLLLNVNNHVPVDRLVDLTWPDGAPDTARAVIHTQVSRLRSIFAGSDDVTLTREGPGYMLRCDPQRIDFHRFRQLCADARATPSDETRIALLDEALAMWDGPALSSVVAAEEVRVRLARPLDEARLVALEERFDAYLRLDRHAEVIHELTDLAARHPDRQQLVSRLMLALHRSDRTPEALAMYQQLYQRLSGELGIEPAPAVRQLHLQILRDDPALHVFTGPRQLPPDVDHYVGREQHLAELCVLLTPERQSAPPVVAVTGKPGLGKTALAVRAAHRLAPEFPDGQLFVDLQGAGPQPRDPAEVLARFLRDLGVSGADIPASLEERMGLFRDRTAARRMLVVLDNATSEEQVRPLIPGNASCGVLITSRRRLTGLDMRGLTDLGTLADSEALALLGELTGQRVSTQGEAIQRIVRLCGGLPLALRIVGTKLRSRPHQTVADLAERLADERNRLDELVGGDREVRASFLLSYDSLEPAQQRAFRLLAVMADTGFPAWAAAAVLGSDLRGTERLLESLVDVNLLECGRGTLARTRYRFHDLIRLYATEKLDPAEQRAARSRLADVYLHLGKRADARLEFGGLHRFDPPPLAVDAPGLLDEVDGNAVGWLADEHPSIIHAVEQSAAAGEDETTCQLSATLAAFLELRAQWADLRRVAELSLAAAGRLESPYWTAYAMFALGLAARETRDFARAEQSFRAGLAILPKADDPRLEVVTLLSVGVGHRLQGRWDEAAAHFAGCLSRLDSLDEPRWRAYALRESGVLYRYRGQWDEAEECLTEAVATYARLGDSRWEAASLRELGIVRQDLGDHAAAFELFTRSREGLRAAGDKRREGAALRCLGWTCLMAGKLAEARAYAEQSRDILASTLDTHGLGCTEVLLGDIHLALGRTRAAGEYIEQGVARIEVSSDPRWRGKSAISLGAYLAASGEHERAAAVWRKALRDLENTGAHEAAQVRALLDA